MPYRIQRNESVQHALRRIADEQITQAIAEIDDYHLDRHQAVHQVRKRCKKIRGLLRLVRPALGKTHERENKAFRNAARQLSSVRDAQVMVEVYDELMDHFGAQLQRQTFDSVRQAIVSRRNEISYDEMQHRLAKARQRIAAAHSRACEWKLSSTGWDAWGGGVAKTHRRAGRSLRTAVKDPSTTALHAWRKRVKYHAYHIRLLRNLNPQMLKPYLTLLNELGDAIGEDHNLAVLSQTIRELPEEAASPTDSEALLGVIQQRRKTIQRSALSLGQRLFAESPEALVDRLAAYWKLWQT